MALKSLVTGSTRRGSGTASHGVGSSEVKVKGKRATARQRETINGVLTQAASDNAGRRVMIAAVMTITQESNAGEDLGKTGNDDTGIFQQGRNWISASGSKDPGRSTHAFLVTGPTSWKKVHGGLKKAPGNLSRAIHDVQRNADPNAYAQWEAEATRTVETWLDTGGIEGAGGVKRYMFTRGEKGGQRENSWDAAQRLVEEVGAYRWAAGNVFYAVSGEELRAQAPSLTIMGDEGWLLKQPAWSWASNRAIGEVTLEVLADRWDVMPGAVVLMHKRFNAMAGRWMVWNVSANRLDSPDVTVVLRRPTKLRSEPPAERAPESQSGGAAAGGLRAICKEISDHRSAYVYGGGHGPRLATLRSNSHMDCSSSVSLALYRAHMFDGSRAITSGIFAASWGKAGKGREFTVWANVGHVWIEGYDDSGNFAWRFDTSQHSGASGPMLTTVPRNDQSRFTPRHWSGH